MNISIRQTAPNSQIDVDVLVVGAGPTGLTLACDLARRGIACRVIDASPTAFNGSRGKGLQPRTLEVFDDLGVMPKIAASSGPFIPFRVYAGRSVVSQRTFYEMLRVASPEPNPTLPFPAPLVIPQWRTDEILAERFAELGGVIDRGVRFESLEQNDKSIIANVLAAGEPQPRRILARFLVGCDGGRSTVRKALGVTFIGETFEEERTLIGDVCVDGLERDVVHMFTHGGDLATRVSLWPLPKTDAFQFVATIAAGDVPGLSLAALQGMVDERWGAGDGAIRLRDLSWLSLYRVNVRMTDRYRVGRAFLAGDAAHVHSSSGGQGLNTSVQDAYNLGWKLAAVLHGADQPLLDTYEQERMPIAADVLGVTTRWHRQQFKNANDAPPSTSAVPALYQLGVNYRGGPLAHDMRANAGSVRAGDRAPDSPLRAIDGDPSTEVRTLFDLLRGSHWTLLFVGTPTESSLRAADELRSSLICTMLINADVSQGPRVDVRATSDEIDAAYDLRRPVNGSALILVRPDGYIGLMADSSTQNLEDTLRAYATMVGLI